jgi:hypothetical protein
MRARGPTSASATPSAIQQLFGKADAAPVHRGDEARHMVVRYRPGPNGAFHRRAGAEGTRHQADQLRLRLALAHHGADKFARGLVGPMADQVALERLEILEMPVETAPRDAKPGQPVSAPSAPRGLSPANSPNGEIKPIRLFKPCHPRHPYITVLFFIIPST